VVCWSRSVIYFVRADNPWTIRVTNKAQAGPGLEEVATVALRRKFICEIVREIT
jgi:hypothetical protein